MFGNLGCLCCHSKRSTDDRESTSIGKPSTKFNYHSTKSSKESQITARTSSRPSNSKWTHVASSTTHLYPRSDIDSHDAKSSESSGYVIDQRYEVLQQIGSGSFGTVYHGKDLQNDSVVAIKILKQKGHQSYYRETSVLKKLQELDGIPQVFWKGTVGIKDILIINRMGCDLSMLFEFCGHKFSLCTTLKLGIEMIRLIQKVHSRGILHRDIKPHNFLMGYKQQKHKLFLIDFGLAKCYYSATSNKGHKDKRNNLMPIGTARYASLWTHEGVSQSRRDDLESIGFVLIYFLKSKLPWQGLKISTKQEKWRKIGNVKRDTVLETLCDGIPSAFVEYLEYVRRLKFKKDPDYEYLIDLLIDAFPQGMRMKDVVYDWDKLYDQRTY